MSYNKVILIGNLTRDPERRYTPKGNAICKIGLALNRKWKDPNGETKEEVAFVDVDAFGKTAENIGKFFKKGGSIMVEGRLKMDTWEDKQTRQQRSKLGIVAESFQFVGSSGTSGGTPPKSDRPAPPAAPASDGPPPDDPDENVPF